MRCLLKGVHSIVMKLTEVSWPFFWQKIYILYSWNCQKYLGIDHALFLFTDIINCSIPVFPLIETLCSSFLSMMQFNPSCVVFRRTTRQLGGACRAARLRRNAPKVDLTPFVLTHALFESRPAEKLVLPLSFFNYIFRFECKKCISWTTSTAQNTKQKWRWGKKYISCWLQDQDTMWSKKAHKSQSK